MIIGFDGSRAFSKNEQSSPGDHGRTGTENYSYQLLRHLAKIESTNKYLVYLRPDSILGENENWPENFEFKTLNYPRLWTQFGLAKQTFIDSIDVLFVPAHTLPLIRKPGLKTVVTVHDLGSEYLPQTHQLKQRLYLRLMQNYQLKTATKIIAVSLATKNDLVKKIGLDPSKIKVIYEGYDKELFRPVKNDALVNGLKGFNLVPQSYFLFVGTVQPRKNLERLIKAFYACLSRGPEEVWQSQTKINLVIAGGKGWLSDEIYALPKKLGIEDRVKFLGRVEDRVLPVLYSGAIAFTFPSLFEGFGLPLIEAQACGCLVLTSNVSSMPEITGKGAIFTNPYSEIDIQNKLFDVINNKKKEAIIKLGFENIKRFSWEKAAKETLEVLVN
jgi:glycosyltransferase involved in cell wall biosynthesis